MHAMITLRMRDEDYAVFCARTFPEAGSNGDKRKAAAQERQRFRSERRVREAKLTALGQQLSRELNGTTLASVEDPPALWERWAAIQNEIHRTRRIRRRVTKEVIRNTFLDRKAALS